MSETAVPPPSPEQALAAAIRAQEGRFASDVLRAMRAPGADAVKVRAAFDGLDAADALRIADRVAEAVERRASRTGDYALVERIQEFLPGQGPRERAAMEAEARTVSAAGRIPVPLAHDDPRYQAMGFAEQHIETNYRLAHGLGVVARVERLAAEGLTARQTVERLGPVLDRVDELARLNGEPHFAEKNKDDLVRAVRNKLDIPNQEDRSEFAAWLAARDPGGVLPPSPAAGEQRPESVRAAPEARDATSQPAPSLSLGPDAQTIYQAVSKLLETHHVIAAEDLKPHLAATLAAREATDGRIELAPEVRLAAGKPPVHTLDEMREVFAAVRERAAVPSDRMTPETAAEVRESLQQQITGTRSMRDLMVLYGQEDSQRAIKSLDAHPEQQRLLTAAMEATGKRLLAEDRVKLGLDEPAERRRGRGVQDAPGDGPGATPEAAGITITRRGDNAAPSRPDRTVDPLARDYDIREKGEERRYHRRDDGILAIRATETHIHGVRRDPATVGAMFDLAASRGWGDVQIKGDREASRLAWIEASARGLRAEGYRPTRDDVHAVEQRRAERREHGLEAPERARDRGDERYPPPRVELPRRGLGL